MEGSVGRAPTLHYIPRHLSYNRGKITEKPQSGHPTGAQLINAERDSFSRHGHHPAMASTGLLDPAALGFRVRRRGQPSVSAGICRVAELGGSPRQL